MDEINIKLVTTNEMKVKEIQAFFANSDIRITHIHQPYPEFQSESIEQIISYALRYLQEKIKGNFLIDDTMMQIPVWNDFPSFYTKDVLHRIGRAGILQLMQGQTDRRVKFMTYFGLHFENQDHIFHGSMEGVFTTIDFTPPGHSPIYRGFDGIVAHERGSIAQLTETEKSAISHRGKALNELRKFFETRGYCFDIDQRPNQ